jgi:D-alanine-D-alanine ligase
MIRYSEHMDARPPSATPVKCRRVLVVVHASLVPPESLEGYTPQQIQDWRAEYDIVSTLRASGHDVRVLGVLDSLVELRAAIAEWEPHVVFNLLEEFDGIVAYDQHVPAFLEMLRQPYTGCNPRGLLISRDKALCKQVFAFHRIPTPQFAVFRRGQRLHVPKQLRYPLFVKSSTDDASLGIAQASVVEDAASLRARVEFVFDQNKSDVLVEEYIEGRECYVGVIGNERLTRLPVWELDFGTMPSNQSAIATRKVKWDLDYRSRYGIGSRPAVDLPPGVEAQLDRLSRRIYRALGLSGFARMDFRVRADGSVFVLEANANPHLAAHEDFARSAAAAGLGYPQLLERLISLGHDYRSPWRVLYG